MWTSSEVLNDWKHNSPSLSHPALSQIGPTCQCLEHEKIPRNEQNSKAQSRLHPNAVKKKLLMAPHLLIGIMSQFKLYSEGMKLPRSQIPKVYALGIRNFPIRLLLARHNNWNSHILKIHTSKKQTDSSRISGGQSEQERDWRPCHLKTGWKKFSMFSLWLQRIELKPVDKSWRRPSF